MHNTVIFVSIKSCNNFFLGRILHLDFSFIHKVNHVLPDQLVNGYFLLLPSEGLLGQPLHHIQMPEVRVNPVRDEQVFDLPKNLHQHFHLLQRQLLVILEPLVQGGIESIVFLSGEGVTSWLMMSINLKILYNYLGL